MTPRVARNYLSPRDTASRPLREDEVAMLARLAEDGVAFAQHGLDHRTRHAEPRRHAELTGLGTARLGALLDEGLRSWASWGSDPGCSCPRSTASTPSSTRRWRRASRWCAGAPRPLR